MTPDLPSPAFIDGKATSLVAAVARAAVLLKSARFPLVAGLGADVEGARAAISLAERLRGAFDHMYSDAVFNCLEVMRDTGMMLTTPSEVRVRADTVLLIGPSIAANWPDVWERLALHLAPQLGAQKPRRLFWLAPGEAPAHVAPMIERIELDATDLPAALAALRARANGRPVGPVPVATLDAIAAMLKAAHIGVAIWSQADLGGLATEMLCGLVFDLNKSTRFSGLPIAPLGNASGVTLTAGWMTGFPMRTSFGRGYPEHDTWRFEAQRLIDSGEADVAVWIDAMDGQGPVWDVPLVALTGPSTWFARPAAVQIHVGRPGLDHDGVLHDAATGLLLADHASKPSNAPSVADVLGQIAAAIARAGGPSC